LGEMYAGSFEVIGERGGSPVGIGQAWTQPDQSSSSQARSEVCCQGAQRAMAGGYYGQGEVSVGGGSLFDLGIG